MTSKNTKNRIELDSLNRVWRLAKENCSILQVDFCDNGFRKYETIIDGIRYYAICKKIENVESEAK